MPVQRSKESDDSQGAESVRSNDPYGPGGHLAGDRTLLRLDSGARSKKGRGWGDDPQPHGPPKMGAFRTARGVWGYVDPDGPAPVHPRSCPGEGSCLYCVALQHWHNCQILKAQRPAPPSGGSAESEQREQSTAIVRVVPGRAEREAELPAQGRRWRRKQRKTRPLDGGEA